MEELLIFRGQFFYPHMTIGFKLLRLRKISLRRLFTYMMIFSALSLLLPRSLTDKLDHTFSQLIGPITKQSRDLTIMVTDQVRDNPSPALSPLEYELINLREKVRLLEEEKTRWAGLREEFGQARTRLILANVIHRDSAVWSQGAFLNRGSDDNIQKGRIVVGRIAKNNSPSQTGTQNTLYRHGIVGRIKETRGSNISTLQLLTDADFQMSVFIEPRWNRKEDWRANGILMGDGKSGIEVKMIRADFPVKVGDPVLACSHPEFLPVAMVVGVVKSCRRDLNSAVFWHITVEPAVDLNTLQQVAVLCPLWIRE